MSQTACVSSGTQDPAYTTIYSCVVSVQSAVSTFKAMKEDGRIVDADGSKEQRVRDAYRVFQQAADVAIEMYRTPEQQRSALEVAQAAMRGALALIENTTLNRRSAPLASTASALPAFERTFAGQMLRAHR